MSQSWSSSDKGGVGNGEDFSEILGDISDLPESRKIALMYWTVAIALFGVQLLFGLIAAYQYINPDFLYTVMPFNITRMLHINAMIV